LANGGIMSDLWAFLAIMLIAAAFVAYHLLRP
jgi:hypothetical protein